MNIADVIRDLGTYFESLGKHPKMSARMGGAVNPSYFEVTYKGSHIAFPFWSVAGGSTAEKKLAFSLRTDIEEFIHKVDANGCKNTETAASETAPVEERPVRKPKGQAKGIEGRNNGVVSA